MFRHITMPVISILLILGLAGCGSSSDPTFSAVENLSFNQTIQTTEGPTRIIWPDREIAFYPITPTTQPAEPEFMMVDLMGDRSIEYILRNSRLEEARFSLPDGSLVRFDFVGLHETGFEPIIYHCTPYSSALYQMSSMPDKLARNIAGFNSRFARWKSTETGILHRNSGPIIVPFERILEAVCCGVEMM